MKARITTTASWALSGSIVALAAIAEIAMGRKTWGISGEPGVWSGAVNSSIAIRRIARISRIIPTSEI